MAHRWNREHPTRLINEATFAEVAHRWNRGEHSTCRINEVTVRKYVKYFNDHGTYFVPSSRGPKRRLIFEGVLLVVDTYLFCTFFVVSHLSVGPS